jgi:uncharacterized protein (TIGR04551 family)
MNGSAHMRRTPLLAILATCLAGPASAQDATAPGTPAPDPSTPPAAAAAPAAEEIIDATPVEPAPPGANVFAEPAEPASPPAAAPIAAPHADEPPGIDPFEEPERGYEDDVWEQEEAPPVYPWLEHHGYFRLRPDWFSNMHLGTYDGKNRQFTSGQPPPLTGTDDNREFKRDDDSIATSNMRFRYEPTFHLAENLSIRAQIDAFDNLVLGSTPDGQWQRNDLPMLAFSGGQAPPESGSNSARDAIRLKRLWAQWKTPVGLLLMGRIGSHWGLGLVANKGDCEDCDYGDTNDRIMFITRAAGTYIGIGHDIVATGATNQYLAEPAGQARDLDDADDVSQWILAVFRRPMSADEKEQRDRDLNRARVPVFDLGFYGVYRTQELTSEWIQGAGTNDRLPRAAMDPTKPDVVAPEDLFVLKRRDAEAWIPDFWAKLEWRPQRGHHLRIELEAAAILGKIGDASPDPESKDPVSRDIAMYGGVLQTEYRANKLRVGFEVGMASGGDQGPFGIHDGFAVPSGGSETDITNFRFDRDYHVDLILFREIIGSVTNALYFKPTLEYDFLMATSGTLGLQIDIIYARALEASRGSSIVGTPSGEKDYGLELDATLFFRETGRFSLQAAYGVFFPFAAFDLPGEGTGSTRKEAETAQTIQGRVAFKF